MKINELKNEKGVYVIIDKSRSDGENIVYKIGFSNKVKDRINQIKRSYNFLGQESDLEIFTIIYCNKARQLEATLHRCLSCYKLLNKHEFFKSTEQKLLERIMMVGDLSRYN
jgi:hypothetical protein